MFDKSTRFKQVCQLLLSLIVARKLTLTVFLVLDHTILGMTFQVLFSFPMPLLLKCAD